MFDIKPCKIYFVSFEVRIGISLDELHSSWRKRGSLTTTTHDGNGVLFLFSKHRRDELWKSRVSLYFHHCHFRFGIADAVCLSQCLLSWWHRRS